MGSHSASTIADRYAIEVRCHDGNVHFLDLESEGAARSTFFAALVIGPMDGARIVNATGDSERVGVLVSYIRKGRLPSFLSAGDAIAILDLAGLYGAEKLAVHCVTWLQYNGTEDTALRVLVALTRARGAQRAAFPLSHVCA